MSVLRLLGLRCGAGRRRASRGTEWAEKGQGREEVGEQGTPGKHEGHERQDETRVGLVSARTRVVDEAGDERGELQSCVDRTRPERQPRGRAKGKEPLAAWTHPTPEPP